VAHPPQNLADFATEQKNLTGRGSVWLERPPQFIGGRPPKTCGGRLNGVQEVTGSSPVAPTIYLNNFKEAL